MPTAASYLRKPGDTQFRAFKRENAICELVGRDKVEGSADPHLELCLRAKAGGLNANEGGKGAAAEHHRANVRLSQREIAGFGAHANHQVAARDATAHLAVNHEGEASDHPLFDNALAV